MKHVSSAAVMIMAGLTLFSGIVGCATGCSSSGHGEPSTGPAIGSATGEAPRGTAEPPAATAEPAQATGTGTGSSTGGTPASEPDPTAAFPFYREDPSYAFRLDEARTVDGQTGKTLWTDSLTEILHPFWQGNVIYNETVLLTDDGSSISGKLLYTPLRILSVRDYTWEKEYQEGKDYTVSGNTLIRTEESEIPYLKQEVFDMGALPDGYRYVPSIQTVETDVVKMWPTIYTEGSLLYGHQICVTYVYDCAAADTSCFASYSPDYLPRLQAKLAAGEDVKIGIVGDSVSEGCSSSMMFGHKPFLPTFADMTELYLNAYLRGRGARGSVRVMNFSKGGETSRWGTGTVRRIANSAPDVLFVHFGINDNGAKFSAKEYRDNMEAIVLRMQDALPDCEIVLMKCSSPEPRTYDARLFKGYFRALDALADGRRVFTLDLYAPSVEMLRTKRYMDLTGNGINHLNDFMTRFYVMNIVASFLDFRQPAAGGGA